MTGASSRAIEPGAALGAHTRVLLSTAAAQVTSRALPVRRQ